LAAWHDTWVWPITARCCSAAGERGDWGPARLWD